MKPMTQFPKPPRRDIDPTTVRVLFDAMAPYYEQFKHIMIPNHDFYVNEIVDIYNMLTNLTDSSSAKFLDIGSGTGDVSIALLKKFPKSLVVLLDNESMLKQAAEKIAKEGLSDRVLFIISDIKAPNLPDLLRENIRKYELGSIKQFDLMITIENIKKRHKSRAHKENLLEAIDSTEKTKENALIAPKNLQTYDYATFNAVFCSFCLSHLTEEQRYRLYVTLYPFIQKGGQLMMADKIFESNEQHALATHKTIEMFKELGQSPSVPKEVVAEFLEIETKGGFENPIPIETELAIFDDIGYGAPSIFYKYFDIAIWGCQCWGSIKLDIDSLISYVPANYCL